MGGPVTLRASNEDGLLRAAFRDAHGVRLNGFALLLTLGDSPLAAALAADALAAGTRHARALRHPERAAAWLRRRVVQRMPRSPRTRPGPPDEQRRETLAALGVDPATYDVLARFSVPQRAMLIAGEVEGFAPLDLELAMGIGAGTARRRLSEVRKTFLTRRAAADQRTVTPDANSLEGRIHSIADRALGRAAK